MYLAFDRHAEEVVALKVLENVSVGSEDLARLRRELGMARRITHPGIVRLHDLVELDGRWALSMEYVDGTSLEARIESGVRWSADEILLLAREMAAALAAAHDAGVTHRDLKPANVLLRGGGRPVISDFGISRAHGQRHSRQDGASTSPRGLAATHEGALVGTPLYMSPEQLEGKTAAGPVVDVYALGLILFEVATGQVPHADATLPAIARRRTNEDAPAISSLRPDLGPLLSAVIDRCLARQAHERYRDGAEVLSALSPKPVAGPQSRAAISRRARSKALRWGAAAALGSAVVAVGLMVLLRPPVSGTSSPEAPEPSASVDAPAAPPPFRLAATGHRRLTFADGCEEFPSFLPGGTRVLFDGSIGPKSHLFVIDVDSGEQRQLTSSPGWDFAASVSADGKRVAFLRAGAERMATYVMDLDPPSEPRLLLGGQLRPSFTRQGAEVWAGESGRPSRVDAASGQVREQLTLPEGKQAWRVVSSPNGSELAAVFVPFLDGGAGGLGFATGQPGARVWRTLLSEPTEEVLSFARGGEMIVTGLQLPAAVELVAIGRETGALTRLTESGIVPGKGLSFSADGRRVVWSTCRGFANVTPLSDASSPVAQAWEDMDYAAMPQGKLIALSNRDGTIKLWLLDPKNASDARIVSQAVAASGVAASPSGNEIVLTTTAGLRVLEGGGAGAERALTVRAGDAEPALTWDGDHVLFSRRDGNQAQVFRVPLAGGVAVATGAFGGRPVALPGDELLFFELAGGSSQPMVWDPTTRAARPLSPLLGPGRYERAAVSPDGAKVAVARNGTEVALVDRASGRIEKVLTMGGDELVRPLFGSDGALHILRTRWVGDLWVADLPPDVGAR